MAGETLVVVIPAYNAALTIVRAIRSCDGLPNTRVIVVNDGSLDATAAVAASAGAVVISQANLGAALARKRGLSSSQSDLVVFLDADDELLASGVTASIGLLQADPSLAVAAGRVVGVLPNGTQRLLPRTYSHIDTVELLTKGFGPWPPAAAVFRRSCLDTAGASSIEPLHPGQAEDYELLLRISMGGRFAHHDQPSARYYIYSGRSSRGAYQEIKDKERVRKYYSEALSINVDLFSEQEIRAAAHFRSAKTQVANRQAVRALVHVGQGIAASPKFFFIRVARKAGMR